MSFSYVKTLWTHKKTNAVKKPTVKRQNNRLKVKYGNRKKWIENNELIEAQQSTRPAVVPIPVGRVTYQTKEPVIDDTRPPPDNIREINIFPDLAELMKNDEDVFLRRNIVNGAYQDIDHYIDVVFRLTREDYMRPLREGVQNHLNPAVGCSVFWFEK